MKEFRPQAAAIQKGPGIRNERERENNARSIKQLLKQRTNRKEKKGREGKKRMNKKMTTRAVQMKREGDEMKMIERKKAREREREKRKEA